MRRYCRIFIRALGERSRPSGARTLTPDANHNKKGSSLPNDKAGNGPIASLDYDSIIEGTNKLIAKLFSGLIHTRGDEFWENETLNTGMVHVVVSAAISAKADREALTQEAQDLYHLRTHETTVLNMMLLHRLRTGGLPPDASRMMGQQLQETISGRVNNPFQRNVYLYRGVIEALVQFFSGEEAAAARSLMAVYDQALALQNGAPGARHLPIDDRKLAEMAYRVILGLIGGDPSSGETTDDCDVQAASDAVTILTAAALTNAARAGEPNASIDALLQVMHNVSVEHLQTSRVQRAQTIATRLNTMNPAEQALMLQSLSVESGQMLALAKLLEREGENAIEQITGLVQAISTAYWRKEGAARRSRH